MINLAIAPYPFDLIYMEAVSIWSQSHSVRRTRAYSETMLRTYVFNVGIKTDQIEWRLSAWPTLRSQKPNGKRRHRDEVEVSQTYQQQLTPSWLSLL